MKRLPKELAVIKLDFDNRKLVPWKRIGQLLGRAGYKITRNDVRQSKRGLHVWLSLDPQPRTPFEVVAIQAILGSDPLRESMNLLRARRFWQTPGFARSWFNVLYTPRQLSRFRISHLGESTNGKP